VRYFDALLVHIPKASTGKAWIANPAARQGMAYFAVVYGFVTATRRGRVFDEGVAMCVRDGVYDKYAKAIFATVAPEQKNIGTPPE
jgi:hypothetical protein